MKPPVATLSNGQPVAHRVIDVHGQRWQPYRVLCPGWYDRNERWVEAEPPTFNPHVHRWTTPPSKPLRRLWYVYSVVQLHEPLPAGEALVFQYEAAF